MNDEKLRGDRLEGKSLHQILNQSGLNSRYRYAANREDFAFALSEFFVSDARYLHISAHGDKRGIQCGSYDEDFMRNRQFARKLDGLSSGRRIFLSSCEAGEGSLTRELFRASNGLKSIVTTTGEPDVNISIAAWNMFYMSLLGSNTGGVSTRKIRETLSALQQLCPIRFLVKSRNS